jgi:hypothetical protein
MTTACDFIETLNDQVESFLADHATFTEKGAFSVGLDPRAAYRLWVTIDAIIVKRSEDRTMQYYGGFEYVDKSHRQEIGDYVFYLSDGDDRVGDCIEFWMKRNPS